MQNNKHTQKSQQPLRTLGRQTGALLLELLIGLALLAIFTPVLVSSIIITREGAPEYSQRQTAIRKLTSMQDALRSVREESWQNVATAGTYHIAEQNGSWILAAGPLTEDDFTQSITISDSYRDAQGVITQLGGTLDPSTKSVVLEVSWTQPNPDSISAQAYLTRYLDNITFTQTTQTDFESGTLVGTAVANNYGGEVVLGSGGHGNWCLPQNYIVTQFDVPENGRGDVVKAIEGSIFTGTDDGVNGKFVDLTVDQSDPPQISTAGITSGYSTNDIFIDENYAYVATNNTSKDIVIIDLNTHQEVGYFNDTFWWGSAQGVFVKGNVGYAVIGPKIHTFDLSSKVGERPELDSVELSPYWWYPATGYRVVVVGNYAYVALDWGSAEMRVVNVANPSNISRAGAADVNSERGKDVFVNQNGTRAYLITGQSSNKRELFILNLSNKNASNMPLVGSYEANGLEPKAISVVTENKLLLVGTGGEEYQVIDIANESNPVRCGGLNLDTGVYGVAGVLEQDGDAFSYIITKEPNAELKVLRGGAGESFASTGTFESETFDSGYATAFNYIMFHGSTPVDTTLRFQVAIADPVSGSCAASSFSYVGPDGTSNTYFTTDGSIPFSDDNIEYENPGRCFRYKLYLDTTDPSNTPVAEDITVNYSP